VLHLRDIKRRARQRLSQGLALALAFKCLGYSSGSRSVWSGLFSFFAPPIDSPLP